jgi:hypothetical protein
LFSQTSVRPLDQQVVRALTDAPTLRHSNGRVCEGFDGAEQSSILRRPYIVPIARSRFVRTRDGLRSRISICVAMLYGSWIVDLDNRRVWSSSFRFCIPSNQSLDFMNCTMRRLAHMWNSDLAELAELRAGWVHSTAHLVRTGGSQRSDDGIDVRISLVSAHS